MKTIYLAIALLLLFSCKKENETIEAAPEIVEEMTPVPLRQANTTQSLIAEFIFKKTEVKDKLASLSAEQANALYDSYKVQNDSLMLSLEHTEQHFLDHYYNYYQDEQGKPMAAPDSIARKEAQFKNAGMEFWGIGEGIVETRTVPTFYLSLFKGHVTKDYEDFIALLAKDDKDLYTADAGLVISFDDVGKRALNWEKFIHKHPYSRLTPLAIDYYREYQSGFLLGHDNTPTIESSDDTFYPENLKAFADFTTANPSSPTTDLITVIIEAEGTKDEITKTVLKAQQKLIDKLIKETTPDYR